MINTAGSANNFLTDAEWSAIVRELGLSGRESDLLRLALQEDRVCVMAAVLGISTNTVHTHRQRLFRKLRVTSFSQALVVVFRCHVTLGRKNRDTQAAMTLDVPQYDDTQRG